MRVSLGWLGDLVEIPVDASSLAERLTKAGLEVEKVIPLGQEFSGVVVAEVLSSRPHPRSQKLTLVTVDAGDGATEVVCGAPNVPRAGRKVLWARPGATLPDGRTLATKEVAGVASPGMLCSEPELGLGNDASGIIILDGEDALAAPGTAAQQALGLVDTVLEIAIPANRGDCLGHIGVAREIAALYGTKRKRPPAEPPLSERVVDDLTSVRIDDPTGCPRYTARLIEGVKHGPAPRVMRRRLEAVGVRSISNIVDVTNYVMFELGQPLHAFDADTLQGGIHVRRARAGERMVTLDGQERALETGDLLICDDSGPIALAGVMGGATTEVTARTTRVLLESASFAPTVVRRTSRRLGLPSEASYRFERGVDPAGCDFASLRAAFLFTDVAGGLCARGVADVYPRPVEPRVVTMRPARAAALLGMDVGTDEIVRCYQALELDVEREGDRLVVTVPTVRRDLEREVDLIEEIARVHGLDDVPATLPSAIAPPETPPLAARAEAVRDVLAGAGLDEAITFGFTSRARIAALRFPPEHPVSKPVAVVNPMRPEHEAMRTSLLPNLLAQVAHNLAFGAPSVRLFEVGTVFMRSERELPDELTFVAGVLCGERPGWLVPEGGYDFYDIKGVVERLLGSLRVTELGVELVPARHEQGFLHPGVAAAIRVAPGPGQAAVHVGVLGEIHPETRDRLGITRPCFAFELNLESLPEAPLAQLRAIPRFPAILRDVSFFVDESVPASRVRAAVEEQRPPLLEELRVLEDYREPGKVPPGKKGMLWSMTYRADGRTLTDAEVDAVHEGLVTGLLTALRAERR